MQEYNILGMYRSLREEPPNAQVVHMCMCKADNVIDIRHVIRQYKYCRIYGIGDSRYDALRNYLKRICGEKTLARLEAVV